MRKAMIVHAVMVAAITLAGCGGDDTTDPASEEATGGATATTAPDAATSPAPSDLEASAAASAQDMADDMVEDLEDTQEAVGGGGATLAVGDESWTFDSVLCAFGEEEIGQEGAELVVSSIQDGLQLYVSIDQFGHSITLDDVEDFENPSVSLLAGSPVTSLGGGEEEFIDVDGKDVTAEAQFTDALSDDLNAMTPGTLEATCP